MKTLCSSLTNFFLLTLQSPVPSGCPLDLRDAEVVKKFNSTLEKLRQVNTLLFLMWVVEALLLWKIVDKFVVADVFSHKYYWHQLKYMFQGDTLGNIP